jgi:predicted  nucleic acid-binding Zn-ribbon protein
MKRKITNFLLAGAFVLAASSTIVSCKDYESDDYQQVKYDMSNLDATMQDKVNELNERINNLTNDLNSFKQTACDQQHCKDAFNALTARIDSLANVSKNHLTSADLADIENRLTTLEGKSDDLSWKDQIKDLKDQIKDLNDKLSGLTPGTSYDDTELRNKINELSGKITELTGKVDNAATKAELKAVKDNVDALLANDPIQDQAIKDLQDKIKEMTGTDQDLRKLIDIINNTTIPQLKEDFQSKVDAANKAAKEAKDSADSYYNKALDAIAATNKTVGNLEQATVDMVAALLTQVIIQSTYSPAVGEFALPLDVKANTLITYYGSNASSFQFPTNDPSYFYKAEEAEGIPAEALRGKTVDIKAGTLIDQDGAEGNAGKLYVTINPNTVDATGVQFALVNSQNKQSAVKVGQASASDRELTWGYTRAAGNNFYEIPATITEDNLSQCTFNVERTGLRTAVKNLVNNRTQTKASIKTLAKEMAQFIYQNMNGVAPRLALSTSYKVGTNDKNRQQLNNVTEMSIMAGAFKPLGFGAFNSIHMETVPGLERAESILSNFINNIKIGKIKLNLGLDHIDKIREVGQLTRNGQDYYVNVKITVDGHDYTDNVNINDQIDDLLKIVNDTLTKANNNAVEKFNSSIDAINTLVTELQNGYEVDLSSSKASMISKIDSYLDRLNDRFTYWFNRSVAASLQPCMLFEGADGQVHRLLSGVTGTTVKGSSIRLVPTTYTYELLAPAYKKFITVTNANLSGTNLGKVISGDTREVTITGLQPGKTYNILYEAVDYNGKVSARQYKINVE